MRRAGILVGPVLVTLLSLGAFALGWIDWLGVLAFVAGSFLGLGIATLRWRHYQRKVDEWNKRITNQP